MRAFIDQLGVTERTRVLDVGGSFFNWRHSPVIPRLTVLNLDARHADCPSNVTWIQGDALTMHFDPGAFDVVFCNSVIEHVGNSDAQQRFANGIRRIGAPYWVQTPNRHFPVEPHFLGLGVQYLPRGVAIPYVKHLTVWGRRTREEHDRIPAMLDEIRLLTAGELRALFPDAALIRERSAGLTKSLIAVRH